MQTHAQDNQWITVGALGDGFAPEAFILPNRTDLAGREHVLHFDNGWVFTHRFGAETVAWADTVGQGAGPASYRATSLREGIYLVDFLKEEDGQLYSVSLVLDFPTSSFTAVLGTLPQASALGESLYARAMRHEELTLVDVSVAHGGIDRPWSTATCPHAGTGELVGLRNMYRYSPTEVYEHVYLNRRFYSWQCLKGVEQGLADTDRCHYYKIADRLYLFVWREKIIPTLGVVMIDLLQHRSDGKICGHADESLGSLRNFPVASYCTVLNRTEYDFKARLPRG